MKNLKIHTETKTRYNSETGAKYEDSNTWIKDDAGNYVCIMRDDRVAEANLFAAAPRMLEALEAAKKYLEPELQEPGRTVFWKLVGAIKKAKGELTESTTSVEKE